MICKPIPGFEGLYSARDDGKIISHFGKGRELRPNVHRNLYHSVMLRRNGQSLRLSVHQLVLLSFVGPTPKGFETDHENRNHGDNRLSNLRYKPRGFNMHNVGIKKRFVDHGHKYKGVIWVKGRKPWIAQICFNRQKIRLGSFVSAKEAAEAYDNRAIEIYGEEAVTNMSLGLLT